MHLLSFGFIHKMQPLSIGLPSSLVLILIFVLLPRLPREIWWGRWPNNLVGSCKHSDHFLVTDILNA